MRLKKSDIEHLVHRQAEFLRSHQLYKQVFLDYRETVFQAVLDTDPVAANMAVVVHSVPTLVRDQLTKVGSTNVYMSSENYQKLRAKVGKELPTLWPFSYHARTVDFPTGKVLYSKSADHLREFKADNEASVQAWKKVTLAKIRCDKADQLIVSAAAHFEQLCFELITLERLMTEVPACRHLIPASWLETPPPAPVTQMVDPDLAAKLRAIVLGDKA